MGMIQFAETAVRDIRFVFRGIRKNPRVVTGLVLTLGLGIGASAAMFSVVDALLLRPLPYGAPGELVQIWSGRPGSESARPRVPLDLARDWRGNAEFLEGGMFHVRQTLLYTGGALAETIPVEAVSPEFEEVLRVRPILGRGITPRDAQPAAEPVTVLSHAFWRQAFGGDSSAIGRFIELDRVRYRVVGIMPEGFKYPMYATTSAWTALYRDGTLPGGGTVRSVRFVGRLAISDLALAQQRAEAMAAAVAEQRSADEARTIKLRTVSSQRGTPDVNRAVTFLAGAVGLILLIALLNGMGLLLIRGWTRARELAVRMALGASRRRLIGQFVTESTVLALMSGVVAVILAILTMHTIRGAIPTSISFFAPYALEISGRTLLFAFFVAVAAGLLVGLVPAIRATRHGRLSDEAGLTRYASQTAGGTRLRRGLVVAEVTLSVMLLVGAGLLVNSFTRLMAVDPGFRMEELAIMHLSVSSESYASREAMASFMNQLERRLQAVPGIEGVAVSTGGFHFGTRLQARGATEPAAAQPTILPFRTVSSDFFQVMQIPIVAGRTFIPGDAAGDAVVIDRKLAGLLWGEANAVGKRFRVDEDGPSYTVVGLIEDVQLMGPDDRTGDYEILYAMAPDGAARTMSFNIRTRGDPGQLFDEIRNAVHTLNPEQSIWRLRSAADAYVSHVAVPRFLMIVVTILSVLALLLTSIGIYGVLAFGVTRRRRELGIRIALGAKPATVARRVLGEGMALAAIGAALGVVGALALSGLIRSLLYGIAPTDSATIVIVLAVGLAAAAVACYWPARRATRVDPMEVLRCE